MESNTVRDSRRWLILAALCLSLLVLMIDSTVLNIAIPTLIRELDATPTDIQWILDSYVLVFAAMLLTAGSLSDRFGRRRMLILGLAVLGVGSLAAVLATLSWQLIAARAVMGLGGALLMPSTLSILMTVFDETERRQAMAAWSAVSILGVIAGPTVGGLLLEHFWWGSVFLLNIPVVLIAIGAALVLMPETTGAQRPLDPVGVILSILALTCTVYLIIEQQWSIAGIAVAVAAVIAFVLWERRQEHPMLPVSLFANRDFTATCLTVLLMVFGMGAVMLMLTQYLQFVLGYGPMQAGLALLPYVLAAAVFNGLGATLGRNLPNKMLIVSGLSVMAAAFVVLALGTGYLWVLVSMVVMGVGGGLAGPAAYAAIMNAIPLRHAGVGSAVNDTLQQVGMALSIAILGSVLAGVYTADMPGSAPESARESIGAALELGYAEPAKAAFTAAVSAGAWVSAGLCSASALLGLALLRAHPAPVDQGLPGDSPDGQETAPGGPDPAQVSTIRVPEAGSGPLGQA